MSIRYILNDPGAQPRLVIEVAPTPAPSGHRARLSYSRTDPEGIYPNDDDPEFVSWQCREIAHRVLSMWETVTGTPLRFWQNGERTLPVDLNRGLGLQALYDRSGLIFYRFDLTQPETWVAASSDAVAHEVGHAILDSLRPDLWNSLLPEVAAFHEGFADCVALLAALFNDDQRADLVQQAADPMTVLQSASAPGTISESVATAFAGSFDPNDPAAFPRQCKNALQWALPSSLPPHATRDNLSREPHSFGRVFAGCFFDVLRLVYEREGEHTEQGLLQATRVAARLLIEAVKVAPQEPRFFKAVGRSMILSDDDENGVGNHLEIRDAFNNHGIALGSAAMLAPQHHLDGPAPSVNASGSSSTALMPETRHSLCDVLGTSRSTPIKISPLKFARRAVSRASFARKVSLAALGKGLEGVTAHVQEHVLLGKSRRKGALLGQIPNALATQREVESLAACLAEIGLISGIKALRKKRQKLIERVRHLPTHAIRKKGKEKRIQRLRFACCSQHQLFDPEPGVEE